MRAWNVPGPVRRYARGWWPGEDGQWPRRYRWTVPIVGLLISVRAFDDRGWFVAAVAALMWIGLSVSTLRGLPETVAWGRAHPVLDSLILVPAGFVALATLTGLGLAWGGVLSVVLWLVVLAIGTARRRRRPAPPPTEPFVDALGEPSAGPSRGPFYTLALVVLAVAATAVSGLGAAPSADARSVRDPDIGWPAGLRAELGLRKLPPRACRARDTRATLRRQDRIDRRDPRNRLYTIFHDRPNENMWGNLWNTACDGGRLQVGVASTGTPANTRRAVARARRYLRERGQSRDVRLVAVRSTYRQLMQAQDAFGDAFATQFAADLLQTAIRPSRNAVVIEVAGKATPADRAAIRAYAATMPVNVLLSFEPPPDPNAPVPTYEATFAVDRATVDRAAREVTVTVDDPSCAADETFDSAARFAGVTVRRAGPVFVLRARFRVNPDWPRASTCEGVVDPRLVVTTKVTLPAPLGRRGIVDGAEGPSGFRFVAVPPVGAKAIRSLVPRYVYSGGDCERGPVVQAFRGRHKSTWCFF